MGTFLSVFLLTTIVTGESSVETYVKTETSGNGNTFTRVETEVNGDKQIFETTKPGTYVLKHSTEDYSVEEADKTPEPQKDEDVLSKQEAKEEKDDEDDEMELETPIVFIKKVINEIKILFSKFFSKFKTR